MNDGEVEAVWRYLDDDAVGLKLGFDVEVRIENCNRAVVKKSEELSS